MGIQKNVVEWDLIDKTGDFAKLWWGYSGDTIGCTYVHIYIEYVLICI